MKIRKPLGIIFSIRKWLEDKALEDWNSYSQQDRWKSYRNSLFRENESGAGVKKQTYQDGCVVYFMWFEWAYTSIKIKREQIYLYRVLIVITLLML